jgi:hypothetical protein
MPMINEAFFALMEVGVLAGQSRTGRGRCGGVAHPCRTIQREQ